LVSYALKKPTLVWRWAQMFVNIIILQMEARVAQPYPWKMWINQRFYQCVQ